MGDTRKTGDAGNSTAPTPTAPDAPSTPEARVLVHITSTVERDYVQRGVFPELRLDNAERAQGRLDAHRLTVDRARELLDDAKARSRDAGLPRGLPWAFISLARTVKADLDWIERDTEAGPSPDAAHQESSLAVAPFAAGDDVLYLVPGSPYPTRVRICGPYHLRAVEDACGRVDYRYGYLFELEGHQYFAPSHRLTDLESKRRHLQLATADGIPTMAWLAATKATALRNARRGAL
jgi:hypothetical protein